MYVLLRLLLLLLMTFMYLVPCCNAEDFVECMTFILLHSNSSSASSPGSASLGGYHQYAKAFEYLHFPTSSSYSYLLRSAQQNPRWLNSNPPLFIITPYNAHEIRAAIICSHTHNLHIRIKSGGHDYEGLSYRCVSPACPNFVIVDLIHFRSISIHLEDETAWVESGATLGELYYSIAQESRVHGFPAGLCPSVGIGGHFSGGGFGTLLRKHGLASDNVLDAYLMDVNGQLMDRESMGEDLFWAIRGGGGASFGIILAWKIKLVRVPPVVTVFTIRKNLQDQETIRLINKWQNVSSNKLPEDLFIRVVMQRINGSIGEVLFNSLFLGHADDLLAVMYKSFPELGLQKENCVEMSWIESVLYFAGFDKGEAMEVVLDRRVQYKSSFQGKSDFVEKPIQEVGLQGIKERVEEEGGKEEAAAFVIMDPMGGRMERIPAGELPFPHRRGNLFNLQYLVKWTSRSGSSRKQVSWMREVYKYMKPYVSSSPRAAYINYRDLDLGRYWGRKYFKGNLERLVRVKKQVDPANFFRNEQTVPLHLP